MKYVYLLMIVNLKSRRMTYCWKRVRCYQTNWMREWSPLSFAHLPVFWSTSVFDTFTSFKQIPALELEASLSGFESTSDNFFVNRLPWLLEQTSSGIIKGSLMLRILLPFVLSFLWDFLSPESASRYRLVNFCCFSDVFLSMTGYGIDSSELDQSFLLRHPFSIFLKIEENHKPARQILRTRRLSRKILCNKIISLAQWWDTVFRIGA